MKMHVLALTQPMFGKYLSSVELKNFIPDKYLLESSFSEYKEMMKKYAPEKFK